MTFTSIGYTGTISPANWSLMAPALGSLYSVRGVNDLRATVASGDRRITIGAGTIDGLGITDVNAAETLTHAAAGSGVRYDTIVARRDWANKRTTLVVVPGSASKAIANARKVGPGVLDDQPIWLIRITAGSSVPVIEADLRCWDSNSGVHAKDALVLGYLGGRPGTTVRIGGRRYEAVLSGSSVVWDWRPVHSMGPAYSATITAGALASNRARRGRLVVPDPGYPFWLQLHVRCVIAVLEGVRFDADLTVSGAGSGAYLAGYDFAIQSTALRLEPGTPIGKGGRISSTPFETGKGSVTIDLETYRVTAAGRGTLDTVGRIFEARVIPA